ncbi:succinylornithine transaminase, also has acetylornitine transaminase activity, PLP-dependent [Xenorhabdus bovienii str. Jollieti]|uniref:Acetylornithine/succinyldiaminopimelate aminotransferase n=1 Tax=Xenorhabdus bovienii (strain SS-2004) TaxID=406818 RepID=D3V8A4_XENBS|nr:aspartate aminotransferase family protein [Xenorhabdus bovienii]CBJ82066.1 succinylornithine transaminase, also has acetylornitine transaminase activity, PLP-dependent [Xenorhabdus bovienii SS-2004]CDH27890.1 succinylornithine transaminase, also has acetylornitine transaminase activity, PLP-dependent [Xenorhabdus bovienii str. Jollieti]
MSNTIQRSWFDQYMVPCFSPAQFIPVRAKGSRVWDQEGKEYVDFAGGIAVNSLGHANDELKKVLTSQIESMWHVGNGYTNEPVLKLAKTLVENTFADKVFFCNSGAEANEAALKIARKYALDKYGSHKNEIISFENSFHGRTLFTVTVGGQPKYSQDFAPLPQQISHLPYNNIDAIKAHISENTCAVIVEPIIGEGGVIPADPAFLKALRELCDQHQALLIFDEIQTGVGRTGYFYAYEETGVEPDILTSAKGLGGGFPIGAMLVKQPIADVFQPGSHGTTFGGNPLAAAVANQVVALVNQPEFLAGVQERHHKFIKRMSDLNQRYHVFSELRGKGLLLGAELEKKYQGKAKTLSNIAAEEGLIALIAGPNVLRFAPALNIEEQDINDGFARLENALKRFVQE